MQCIRNGAYQRQTDAGAASFPRTRAVGSIEFLPDLRKFLFGQAVPFIEYRQTYTIPRLFGRNLYLSAVYCIADCIGQIIHQYLVEQITVRADRDAGIVIFHCQAAAFT